MRKIYSLKKVKYFPFIFTLLICLVRDFSLLGEMERQPPSLLEFFSVTLLRLNAFCFSHYILLFQGEGGKWERFKYLEIGKYFYDM